LSSSAIIDHLLRTRIFTLSLENDSLGMIFWVSYFHYKI
jgi:hypothetical protein